MHGGLCRRTTRLQDASAFKRVLGRPKGLAHIRLVERSTSAATSGNAFRLADASSGNYIFNLATKDTFNGGTWSFSSGTWKLIIELNDGSKKSALIDLGT